MAENLSTNYLINFIAQTQGTENAKKALASLETEIQKIYGKEVKVRGIKEMGMDANGAAKYILQLQNAVQKLKGTTRATVSGKEVATGREFGGFMGGKELTWVEEAQRWRGSGGRFVAAPLEMKQGPIPETMMKYTAQLEKTTVATDKHGDSVGLLGANYAKLAIRAIAVIPIWMLLRNSYMQLFSIIGEGFKRISDLDKALAKMGAVTQGINDPSQFLKGMREELNKLSLETGKSIEELTNMYVSFAETGIKATVAQAGLNTAVKLSVAIFSDSAEVSRMLIDLYIMFGDTIKEANTAQEKMGSIAGLFTVLWKDNAGKLNEYIEALKNFSGVAKGANLSLDEMMTLVVVLHNFMQRGGMAGTQLSRAFQEMPKNIKNIELFLGKPLRGTDLDYFDLFLEILKKLNEEIKAGRNVPLYILELFGERSQKGVLGLASGYEKLLTVWTKIKNLPLAEKIKVLNEEFERQRNTIDLQVQRFTQLKDELGKAFIEGITIATDFEQAMERINWVLEKSIDLAQSLGIALIAAFAVFTGGIPGAIAGAVAAIGLAVTAGKVKEQGRLNTRRDIVTNRLLQGVKGELSKEEYKQLIKEYETGALDDVLNQFGGRNQKTLDRLKQVLEMLEKGVDLAKIKVLTNKEEVKILDDISYKYEVQAAMAERLKTLGYSEIEIEKEKLALLNETGGTQEEIFNQRVRIIQAINKEIIEQSEILKKSFINAFEGLFKGEQTLAQSFANIGKTITDTFYTNLSEGLTEKLFKMTGIGELFGVGMTSLKQGIGGTIENAHLRALIKGGDVIEKSHIKGIVKGFLEAQGRGGAATASFGGTGGFTTFGIGGNGFTAPGFGEGGWFNQPVSRGRQVTTAMGKPVYSNQVKGGAGGLSRGQLLGAGMTGALTGYSMYQSSRAGGIPQGQAIGAGVLGGAGGLAGGIMGGLIAAGGTLLGMGPVGWGILAGVLLIGSILGSTLGGKKTTQTSIETKTTENRISSRIDVTNKNLEIINRNLIALRSDIQTYILPASAYFAEKRNLEDEFSLYARRGYGG